MANLLSPSSAHSHRIFSFCLVSAGSTPTDFSLPHVSQHLLKPSHSLIAMLSMTRIVLYALMASLFSLTTLAHRVQPRSTFSKRSTGLIINTLGDLSAQLQPHIDSIHSDLARLGSAHAWERPAIGSSIYASLSSCHQAVVSCGSTTPPPPPPRPSNAPAPPSSPYYGNSDISNAAGIAANIVRSVHSCTVAVGSVLHQIPQMELSFTHFAQELDYELTSYLGSCERQIPGLLAMTSSNCGEYIRFYSHSMMYSKLWGGPSLQPYNTECHFGSLFDLLGHKRLGW